MMQNEVDRREEWMGLGLILNELRFRVWVEQEPMGKHGMRIRKRITWRTLFSSGSYGQQQCVEKFLAQFDIPLKEKYFNKADFNKWLLLLDRLEKMYGIRSALTDQKGLHMLEWVYENPIPRKWDDFVEWVECYDAEREMVG